MHRKDRDTGEEEKGIHELKRGIRKKRLLRKKESRRGKPWITSSATALLICTSLCTFGAIVWQHLLVIII